MRLHRRYRTQRPKGSMLILVLLLLVVLFAGAAFSIDVAYMQLARMQLRNTADSAAIAGAEALARTRNEDQARKAAKDYAAQNLVVGKPLLLEDSDIIFGQVVDGTFVSGKKPYNSVRVRGAFTAGSRSGNIGLFFGNIFNRGAFEPVLVAAATNQIERRDICVVVDRSGSMAWPATWGDTQSKWQALLQAFNEMIDGLDDTDDDEQLGLASYSSTSTLDSHLHVNYNNAKNKLQKLTPDGSTNIYSGIMDGITVLTEGFERKDVELVMVVMTDGLHNTGPEPIRAAEVAKAKGIRIVTVTFGQDADLKRMAEIAELCGGKHYHAPSGAALKEIFHNIGMNTDGIGFSE